MTPSPESFVRKAARLPWAMCDWGAIRALSRDAVLTRQFCWVLSDTLFLEAVDSHPLPEMLEKLRSTLNTVQDRILFTVPWGVLSQKEVRPQRLVHRTDIIDVDVTIRMRDGLSRGVDWVARAMSGVDSPELEKYRAHKREFLEQCTSFAEDPLHKKALRPLLRHQNEAQDWIKDRRIVPDFIKSVDNCERFRSPAWIERLRVFPDRAAIGRQIRLVAWYAIQRVMRPEQNQDRFANNFEDAMYAFGASYARNIATNDADLQQCIRALFPGVGFVSLASHGS